jgi:predicted small metal-binding protein
MMTSFAGCCSEARRAAGFQPAAIAASCRRIDQDSRSRHGREAVTLPMKTMTCKQLGGPCNVEHHGKDHNEVIKAQDRHLKAQVAAGDETHRQAHEAMRGRWKRPISGLGWYREVKRDFASLPDDA